MSSFIRRRSFLLILGCGLSRARGGATGATGVALRLACARADSASALATASSACLVTCIICNNTYESPGSLWHAHLYNTSMLKACTMSSTAAKSMPQLSKSSCTASNGASKNTKFPCQLAENKHNRYLWKAWFKSFGFIFLWLTFVHSLVETTTLLAVAGCAAVKQGMAAGTRDATWALDALIAVVRAGPGVERLQTGGMLACLSCSSAVVEGQALVDTQILSIQLLQM
jgi:hypothetical protein